MHAIEAGRAEKTKGDRAARIEGFNTITNRAVTADGAAWIWRLSADLFPVSTQIVQRDRHAAFLAVVEQVPAGALETSRLGLRLTDDEVEELRQRLHDLLEEFHRRPASPDAEPWSVFLALHPDAGRST